MNRSIFFCALLVVVTLATAPLAGIAVAENETIEADDQEAADRECTDRLVGELYLCESYVDGDHAVLEVEAREPMTVSVYDAGKWVRGERIHADRVTVTDTDTIRVHTEETRGYRMVGVTYGDESMPVQLEEPSDPLIGGPWTWQDSAFVAIIVAGAITAGAIAYFTVGWVIDYVRSTDDEIEVPVYGGDRDD